MGRITKANSTVNKVLSSQGSANRFEILSQKNTLNANVETAQPKGIENKQ